MYLYIFIRVHDGEYSDRTRRLPMTNPNISDIPVSNNEIEREDVEVEARNVKEVRDTTSNDNINNTDICLTESSENIIFPSLPENTFTPFPEIETPPD